jgi:CheY-like chemotaxis protein
MNIQHTKSRTLLHFAYWPSPVAAAHCAFTEGRRNLVVADDNLPLRGLVSTRLGKLGYHVRSAEDGEEAWASLLAEPFDLLITDNEMPRLGGLELLRRMRAASIRQPVILISGSFGQITPEIKELLLPGAALAKPFLFADLLPTMEMLLQPVGI